MPKRDGARPNSVRVCTGHRLQRIRKPDLHSRNSVQVDQRLRLRHSPTSLNLPRVLRGRPILPGISCPGSAQIFHPGFLLPGSFVGHCFDCLSSGRSCGRFSLHRQLFRTELKHSRTRQRDNQKAATRLVLVNNYYLGFLCFILSSHYFVILYSFCISHSLLAK